MSTQRNVGFSIQAPHPIDSRFRVATYSGLALMAIPYEGLITYVVDEKKDYRYSGGVWTLYTTESGGISEVVWGSINGDIIDQTDLYLELLAKLNTAGGNITGPVFSNSTIEAVNFITIGSASATTAVVSSTTVGEPAGSISVKNIVLISLDDYQQAETDGTLVVGTKYLII